MTKRFIAAALAVLLTASCSGSTPEEVPPTLTVTTTTAASTTTTPITSVAPTQDDPAQPPTTTVVAQPTAVGASLRYTPDRDGFSFENFGGGEAPAELTVNMARRFYGDEQVCSSVVDNQCTPYPVILQLIQQANRSMRGGLCEGLTVLSLRLANDPAALASFQNVEAVASLVKADPALLSEIAYWYVTQFATEVQEQASAFLELSPLALARILYEDFAAAEIGEPSVGYTVGIYSEHGGHAVTPYKVTTDGDRWRVYIYDSNWPNSDRWIDVDKDGWTYALAATNPTEASEAWGGGVGTMELTPMTSRVGPFTCGFCPTEDEEAGTMLTVAASGDKQMSIQVETDDGDRLGYYDGTFVNEIEGATYRYLISGPSTADPVLVFLPPGIDNFSADVDVIGVPTPAEVETSRPSSVRPFGDEAPLEPEPEEDITQAFSLLILDDERAVQIEAAIAVEPELEPVEPGEPEPERAATSLIQFSDESVEIADIEEATVAIAVDSLEVEIEIDNGQQVAVQFAPEPPPITDPTAPVEQPAVATLAIQIADNAGEVIAEVEVDLVPYRVEDSVPEPVEPGQPEPTTPPEPVLAAPVVVTITFDEDTGIVEQEEEVVEAWVASDAEYFRAVAEDRVDEVLGESYVDEIEERNEWEPPPGFDDGPDLAETLIVEDDYWEDEQWDEVDYDDEYFEDQAEAVAETFAVVEEEEWWGAEPEAWTEEFVDDWDDAEFVNWAAEEEQHILNEMGLTEWNDELMGPPPTETVDWIEEDWIAFDEEMDAIWEERMADPEVWEETILDDLGVEEWNPEWGPSPTESADWENEDWDAFDEQWAADEEAQILADEGLDEWPEDWGPSPTESALWVEADWIAYDAEQEALWEQEQEPEPGDDPERCDDCDPVDEWEPDPDWSGADEEAWILEQEGFDEWPEDWGPSPSESWGWEEADWQAYDEQQEALREEEWEDDDDDWGEETEEAPSEDALLQDGLEVWPGWDNEEWSGADEEAWILEQEGFDEWPEDWGPSPTESWDWTEDEWLAFDEEQEALWAEQEEETDVEEAEEASSSEDEGEPGDPEEEPDPDTDPDTDPEAFPGGGPRADGGTWSGTDEEAWILEEEGLDAWPADWGPPPSESWEWTEDDWQAYDEEHRPLEPGPEPEPEPEPSVEVHPGEGVDPHTVEGWSGEDEEGWILDQEGLTEWPADWGPSPSESWDWEPEEWQAYDEEHGVPPPPEPEIEPAGWGDPYAGCRGTAACENAPGGFTTWAAYDQANDPAYFDDWGAVPIGFVGWVDYTDAVESGEVDAEEAGVVLPAEVRHVYIPVVVPVAVYYPTITYTYANTALSETISTATATATTGTATTTNVTTALTNNDNDGYWYEAVATATTVTTTFVDTTTVVARTGSDMTTCTLSDGVQQGCTTVRGWSPETTTATVGDAYTAASTSTANSTIPASCDQGGWTGLGDWCIVDSTSRTDYEHVAFQVTASTNIRIDAESNLTYAAFSAGNSQFADPYIFLNYDTDTDNGSHSGDTSEITVGTQIAYNDDGGRDCGSTCANPPSNATDPDEFPNSVIAWDDGDTPVIVNVSDSWDARIEHTLAAGDYVVRGSVFSAEHNGWYRLTIREND